MPRIAATAALVAVLALGAACSDDADDPGAEPSSAGTSTSPADPSSSATPGTEPATGIELALRLSTVRVPEGWERTDVPVSTLVGAKHADTSSTITLGEIDAFGGTPSTDELAQTALAAGQYPLKPAVLPPADLDGVEAYHLSGKIQRLTWLEELGAVVDDRIVTLSFQFSPEFSAAERQEVVDSVVASFRWT